MKFKKFQILIFFTVGVLSAQVESNSSLRIDRESDLKTDKYSLSNYEADKEVSSTLYDLPEELKEYNRRNIRPFDMTGEDGFFKPKREIAPKWFEKNDKNVGESGAVETGDIYYGDFKSNGKFVTLVYRDFGEVDGDIVRIYINDFIIGGRVFLTGIYKSTKITLLKGLNRIDIQAINEGEGPPNTAEFYLIDDQGNIITGSRWNLAAGKTATMIIVKD